MISYGCDQDLSMKGGINIPNKDFITALFNIDMESIEQIYSVKVEHTFHYHITFKLVNRLCPYCGGKTISHGKKQRLVHHPNLIDFDGVIHYHSRRYICKDCNHTFFERNPFAFANFTNSIALINRVMKQLSNLDLSFLRIAELNHISVTTVQLYLDSYVSIPKPSLPENLGIDELHSKMSANDSAYLCVLIDNENRYPVDILNSRSKLNLNRHFDKYPLIERNKVKYVTIDMWKPYKDVALRQFKNCKIAVDPFHVVKHLCDAFTKIRITIMNQCPYNSDAYYLLKKWHFLLDKNDVNLDNEPQYNHRFNRKLSRRILLDMVFGISDKLLDAYNLKFAYQQFNDFATSENCAPWLDNLIHSFSSTYIVEYHEFAALLVNWRVEIINSFERPHNQRKQSNALAENVNSKLRAYLALIRGSHNFTRFRKRVLFALNPKIFYAISNRLSSDKLFKPPRGSYHKNS